MDAQDLGAPLRVRRVQLHLAVEAAGAAQRGIERVGAVGRADDDHLPARLKPIHQREELPDDALLHLAPDLGALRRDGVDLVQEDHAGRVLLRVLEDAAQVRLALAIELVDDLRAR